MSDRLTPDGLAPDDLTPDGLTPDELDRLLDGLVDGGQDAVDPDASVHAHALLSTARQVRDLADEPIPVDVRDRHLVAIRRAAARRTGAAWSARSTSDRATSGWLAGLRRRVAAIAAATSLAFAATGGGAVALAQGANPDDALYGLKRASESVALAVTSDDARLHLQFAERRLDELEAVPGHAPELASAAAKQLHLAHEHGADLGEAGAQAVARLSELVAGDQLGNDNARTAVARACDRIAQRNPNVDNTCGYRGDSPGNSGDAPGRQGDPPGERGNSGDAPGRSGDAPRGGNEAPVAPQGADGDEDPGASDGVRGKPDEVPPNG